MNHTNSAEFSRPDDSAFFGKGDRVRLRSKPSEELGTVVYACKSARGHSVTVQLDQGGKRIVLSAGLLEKCGAMF